MDGIRNGNYCIPLFTSEGVFDWTEALITQETLATRSMPSMRVGLMFVKVQVGMVVEMGEAGGIT